MNPLSHGHRTALSVNVNKVALVRNTRHLGIPGVLRAARLCLQAGANGITVHPRPDERHIRASDVHELAQLMKDWPDREYNIEGNPSQNLMDFIRQVRPTRPLCARQRRPVHQRPWLELSAGCRPPGATDCRMPGAGRARELVHGPGARTDGTGPGGGCGPGGAVHRTLCRGLGAPTGRPRNSNATAPPPRQPWTWAWV